MTNKRQHILIYARYSSDLQRDGTSEERQREATLTAAKRFIERDPQFKDYVLNNDVFFDRAVSSFKGKNLTDPDGEWSRCMNTIQPNDLLILEAQNRFSRLPAHRALTMLEDFLIKKQFSIVFLTNGKILNAETFLDGFNDLELFIGQKMANKEQKDKGVLIAKAHRLKKEESIKSGKPKLFCSYPGWVEWDPIAQHYSINEQDKTTIKKMFEMRLSGMGVRTITKKLNALGLPVTSRVKRGWHRGYVSATLRNPSVIGYCNFVQNGKKMYPPVISDELFYAVGAKMSNPKKFCGRTDAALNLFSHIAKCKDCGMPLQNAGGVPRGKARTEKVRLLCFRGTTGQCRPQKIRHDLILQRV